MILNRYFILNNHLKKWKWSLYWLLKLTVLFQHFSELYICQFFFKWQSLVCRYWDYGLQLQWELILPSVSHALFSQASRVQWHSPFKLFSQGFVFVFVETVPNHYNFGCLKSCKTVFTIPCIAYQLCISYTSSIHWDVKHTTIRQEIHLTIFDNRKDNTTTTLPRIHFKTC